MVFGFFGAGGLAGLDGCGATAVAATGAAAEAGATGVLATGTAGAATGGAATGATGIAATGRGAATAGAGTTALWAAALGVAGTEGATAAVTVRTTTRVLRCAQAISSTSTIAAMQASTNATTSGSGSKAAGFCVGPCPIALATAGAAQSRISNSSIDHSASPSRTPPTMAAIQRRGSVTLTTGCGKLEPSLMAGQSSLNPMDAILAHRAGHNKASLRGHAKIAE